MKPDRQDAVTTNELKTIQVYEDLLFACYRDDYILIFHANNFNSYNYDQMVSVRYNDTIPINSFHVYNQQLWISACYIIYIYDISTTNKKRSYKLIMKSHLDDDHLLTMLGVCDYIWAGSSRGNIYIFRTDNFERLRTFNGHKDGVCCLCPMLDTYVISGSQQFDTSIVIWENINKFNVGTNIRF
jgi:WD40 repeat protein